MSKAGNARNKVDISCRYRLALHCAIEFHLIQLGIIISHIAFILNNRSLGYKTEKIAAFP